MGLGLNLRDQPYALLPGQSRRCHDVVFTERGAIKTRNGSTLLTDAGLTATPISLHAFELDAGTKWLVTSGQAAGPSNNLYKTVAGTGVTTALKTGLTANAKWDWTSFKVASGQGPLWGMNGTDTPQQWNGLTGGAPPSDGLSHDWTGTNIPNGKFLKVYGNRIYVSGKTAAPSTVYFSELNDPTNFPSNNNTEFRSQDGDQVTGLGLVGDYLIVFKTNACWTIYDSDTSANRLLDNAVGCVSDRSVVSTPYGLIFLAKDGVHWTNGSQVRPISNNIVSLFGTLVPAQRQNASGVYINGHYYLSVCTSGSTNNTILDCDLRTMDTAKGEAVWARHILPISELAVQDNKLYGALHNASKVYTLFVDGVTADDGVAINWEWVGPWYTFGTPYLDTNVRQFQFDGKGRFYVQYAKAFNLGNVANRPADLVGDAELWGVAGEKWADPTKRWAAGVEAARASLYELGTARAWSPRFSPDPNYPTDQVTIYSMTWDIQKRNA